MIKSFFGKSQQGAIDESNPTTIDDELAMQQQIFLFKHLKPYKHDFLALILHASTGSKVS